MEPAVQVFGSLLVLIAFLGSQRNRLATDSEVYLALNLVGSTILAVLAAVERQPGFFLLEFCWAIVAASSLARINRWQFKKEGR